jgi:DnaK suppressor protein
LQRSRVAANRSIVFTVETNCDVQDEAAVSRSFPGTHFDVEFAMSTGNPGFDAAFIDKQRQYLLRLRSGLRTAARSSESDETDVRDNSADGAQEYEDDAQKLAALELDGNLVVRDLDRLERVDRALKKIDEGTYGLSDVSGLPIPRERLEAVPEAICTLAEEKGRESRPRASR